MKQFSLFHCHTLLTGVDMTPAQLEVAVRNSEAYARDVCGYKSGSNMTFIHVSDVPM